MRENGIYKSQKMDIVYKMQTTDTHIWRKM